MKKEVYNLLNKLNVYQYPYDSGLWVKSFDLYSPNSGYIMYEKEKELLDNLTQNNDLLNNNDFINQLIEELVNYRLISHIDESIIYFYLIKTNYYSITFDKAKKITYSFYQGLSGSLKKQVDYSWILNTLFEKENLKQDFKFYTNIDLNENRIYNIESKIYFDSDDSDFLPCVIGTNGVYLLFIWLNE